jgi:hypothetical protein
MRRYTSIAIILFIFVALLLIFNYIAMLVQQTIEKLTVWLVFGEIMTGVGLVYLEASPFLLEQPTAEIAWTRSAEESLTTDVGVFSFGSLVAHIRQLEVKISVSQNTIKEAEFLLSVRDAKKILPRSLRIIGEPVSWTKKPPERVNLQKLLAGQDSIPQEIRATQFGHYETNLKSGTENYATLLFTVEGHRQAYLTTKEFQSLPLGYRYIIDVKLIGENLPESHVRSFYVELYDWNDIHFTYTENFHFHFIKDYIKRKGRLQFYSCGLYESIVYLDFLSKVKGDAQYGNS